MGTVLGGSSIVKPAKGKNCYLFMRSKNKEWLIYKTDELTGLSSQRPFNVEGNTLRWHSSCYPIFNEFYDLFYKNKKKNVTMQILDKLRDIGLATWYGDVGKLKKNKITLNTHKFGLKGTKIIAQFLTEVGIGESEITKERNSYRLVLPEQTTNKFLPIIADRLPEFMYNKIF